jgi:dihydroorotate dehydrogenase subfamily 2
VLRVQAFGRDLPGPLGLAAGFDKDALGPDALGAMGFAFVEVGTVTAQPQQGNPRPRMFRLPRDRALINRMGFNNQGAAAAAARLRSRRSRRLMTGANIGKTKAVPESEAAGDYAASARLLGDVADYLVINVSSPNTPGLRNLQAATHLRPLVTAVREALETASTRPVPLLVKIAPDLADDDIDAIADLALELGLDGIIATNTTITRDHLATGRADVDAAGAGGLSGAPLRPPTTRGTASRPGRPCWRHTPHSSTAARCGPAASTMAWRAAPARRASPRSSKPSEQAGRCPGHHDDCQSCRCVRLIFDPKLRSAGFNPAVRTDNGSVHNGNRFP